MAAEAGVKTVVLNHQIAGATATLAYAGLSGHGIHRRRAPALSGEVIVGQDLMVL
jgi:hypothetical protein